MIIAPTPCYFTGLATDEAAQAIMMEISPAAAADITEVSLISADFESDITALNNLDGTIKHVNEVLDGDVHVDEKFNPLYIPAPMEDVDSLLELNVRSDGVRFTGFGGDPFALKMVDVRRDDQSIVMFTARYHPFDLPLYTEIVEAHDRFSLN